MLQFCRIKLYHPKITKYSLFVSFWDRMKGESFTSSLGIYPSNAYPIIAAVSDGNVTKMGDLSFGMRS